jgi:murein DD-endopeptidase MepM/ murein hydrolase activator NlpD
MATTLAVLRNRPRAIAAGIAVAATLLVPSLAPEAASAATRTASYGWPVKPFHTQHPVRGFFGDPRIGMTPKGMRSSFHFGIDISCPNGTAVYATLDGVVRLESFRPETVSVVGRDGHTEFQYWHIKPAVRNGQRVKAYVTVVGWAEPPWEHVHFSERRDGVYVNPLRPGALGPFSDTTTPWVKQLRAEVGGRPVSMARGAVDLVVEAYDETPVRVPGRWGGKPVTPALLRWRVTTAARRVVRPWRSAIDHRLTTPSNDLYSTQYGRWTRQNKKNRPGRFRFVLQSGWDSRTVTDGLYVVEIAASDLGGNSTVARFPIRVANSSAPV